MAKVRGEGWQRGHPFSLNLAGIGAAPEEYLAALYPSTDGSSSAPLAIHHIYGHPVVPERRRLTATRVRAKAWNAWGTTEGDCVPKHGLRFEPGCIATSSCRFHVTSDPSSLRPPRPRARSQRGPRRPRRSRAARSPRQDRAITTSSLPSGPAAQPSPWLPGPRAPRRPPRIRARAPTPALRRHQGLPGPLREGATPRQAAMSLGPGLTTRMAPPPTLPRGPSPDAPDPLRSPTTRWDRRTTIRPWVPRRRRGRWLGGPGQLPSRTRPLALGTLTQGWATSSAGGRLRSPSGRGQAPGGCGVMGRRCRTRAGTRWTGPRGAMGRPSRSRASGSRATLSRARRRWARGDTTRRSRGRARRSRSRGQAQGRKRRRRLRVQGRARTSTSRSWPKGPRSPCLEAPGAVAGAFARV